MIWDLEDLSALLVAFSAFDERYYSLCFACISAAFCITSVYVLTTIVVVGHMCFFAFDRALFEFIYGAVMAKVYTRMNAIVT